MSISLKSVTIPQRRVLWLMRNHGQAAFFRGGRKFKWLHAGPYVQIETYGTPSLAMVARGMIEHVSGSESPPLFLMTQIGTELAERLPIHWPREWD